MKTLFKNLHLIDGTGTPVRENCSILVEDGKILELGENLSFDGEVVDLGGKYVMPGLIDCHVHTFFGDPTRAVMGLDTETDYTVHTIKNLEALLKGGVTYIRDAGSIMYVDVKLKKHLQAGTIKGPGMHCCGPCICMTGGHAHQISVEVDGPDEMRKEVRDHIKNGVDAIKFLGTAGVGTPGVPIDSYQLNTDEMAAGVLEAHKVGKKTLCHAHSADGVKNAILAGVDSVEHATLIDDEGIKMAAENGTWIVPTFDVVRNIIESEAMQKAMPEAVERAKAVSLFHGGNIKKAYDLGVKIAMGTDCNMQGMFDKASARELSHMAAIGIPNMEVIKMATKNGAELIGIEGTHGTLEAGKVADFIVMAENPVEDITAVQRLSAVYQAGKVID